MSGATAWVMQLDHQISAAVGQMELIHIVDNPEFYKIPGAPAYCAHVILWNNRIIPVMDLSAWLNDSTVVYSRSLVAIAVYRDQNNELKYGGIHLSDTPAMEEVSNDQACALPMTSNRWRTVSISCFRSSDNNPVPILDVPTIFSTALAESA
ncbi:MAG: chemotaxis protein CheW [Gammaproteobacteria bacterium]